MFVYIKHESTYTMHKLKSIVRKLYIYDRQPLNTIATPPTLIVRGATHTFTSTDIRIKHLRHNTSITVRLPL